MNIRNCVFDCKLSHFEIERSISKLVDLIHHFIESVFNSAYLL